MKQIPLNSFFILFAPLFIAATSFAQSNEGQMVFDPAIETGDLANGVAITIRYESVEELSDLIGLSFAVGAGTGMFVNPSANTTSEYGDMILRLSPEIEGILKFGSLDLGGYVTYHFKSYEESAGVIEEFENLGYGPVVRFNFDSKAFRPFVKVDVNNSNQLQMGVSIKPDEE